MPQKPKYNLPTKLMKESLGDRLAKLRKEKGLTQVELSKMMGIRQVLVSDYERNRLRPNYEMIINFASILEVSADELLGLKAVKKDGPRPNLRISKRLKKLAELPPAQQKALLKTIDNFIKANEK